MSKFVLVECISSYRMRYVIELNDNDPKEWALDSVSSEDAKEFSQEWLGEQIFSHRVLSKEEVISLCDEDNNYFSDWSEDKKIDVFVTEIGYKKDA